MGRAHVEVISQQDVPAEEFHSAGWPAGARLKTLSLDDTSGALTGILQLGPGYRRPVGSVRGATEILVLSGAIRIGRDLRGFGYYECNPAEALQDAWIVPERCELLFMARKVGPEFTPVPAGIPTQEGRIALDTETLAWEETPIPGPPPGLVLKPLRIDAETGEMAALWSHPSRFPADGQYTSLEFHECVEESYCLSGDMWIGTSGTMTEGSYFWRPPYISHGPFYSRTGSLTYVYFDGPLVNHLHDAARTPEENRRWITEQRAAEPALAN
jgi:hypothetical protein